MLFNSIDFALFLPIVFLLYWSFYKSRRAQNILLLIASYVFYAWWDWRFLSLIFLSTAVDYGVGYRLKFTVYTKHRQILLALSLIVNLGILFVFKYYNFFIESFVSLFSFMGKELKYDSLYIVLPVGISFYTFQTLSYTIDVYRKKIDPTNDFISFATFVAFFPQLVAGPIERAQHLLPQFETNRVFNVNKAKDGLRQILWGLFKKMVIADNCAKFVDLYFTNYEDFNGSALFLGAVLFSVQIYCDFSGYTDIAIGVARLFGFNLNINFRYPYFSRNIAEFWRRWHLSLSTWFRDYVYIPLGGSRVNLGRTLINLCIVFMLSALWHGANWTFLIWGCIHVLMYCISVVTGTNRVYTDAISTEGVFPSLKILVRILTTFLVITLAWVFFRSEHVGAAIDYLNIIFSRSFFEVPRIASASEVLILLGFTIFLCFLEWRSRIENHALETFGLNWKKGYRWGFYYILLFVIFYFYGTQQQFIYFQF
jgi:alginate O-acetyltransferase complex protein AlgI